MLTVAILEEYVEFFSFIVWGLSWSCGLLLFYIIDVGDICDIYS